MADEGMDVRRLGATWDQVAAAFRWRIPARFNIAADTVDRHVSAGAGDATALIHEGEDGSVRQLSFAEVQDASARLANVLRGLGLGRGDRVAILLPQVPETAIAHVAAYRAGLIAVPLFVLFGPDALEYRLRDSGAAALITDAANWPKVAEVAAAGTLPDLRAVLVVDGGGVDGTLDFQAALGAASAGSPALDTAADDPAIIIYTSGTTGPPKGALHAHRFLLGHLPGVQLPHERFPHGGQPPDLMWTPADWAWIGGLYDVLFPAWHYRVPVLAYRFRKFDPERAMDLVARHRVTSAFLPPTALKLLRLAGVRCPDAGLQLRSVGSGGETLGGELLDWGRETLGVTINEFYGQTECNLIVSNSSGLLPVRPGSMGRPVPGHEVAVISETGERVGVGEEGEIAVQRPDPVMFLEYWRQPQATRDKFVGDPGDPGNPGDPGGPGGDWLRTGDRGVQDEDGYLWFRARADDVITSAGYRIGPGEIEDCLLRHPAVAMAAAVGVPDPVRTEVVKAFIVLKPGVAADDALTSSIRDFVRTRLAAHEYPRLIEYVPDLPLTATGKVMRRELRARG